MKGRKLQMERAAYMVLQAPRFVKDSDEETLLTDLLNLDYLTQAHHGLAFAA